jgi:hypothetical protein
MAECLVNEARTNFENSPETWGDLLDRVDRSLVADGRVVTAVRFDGVDQPSFRAVDLAAVTLGTIARVDIDAVDAAALLCGTLDTARESLPSLALGARQAAEAFRAGPLGDAHQQLASLVQAVQSLITLTAAMANVADASLGAPAAATAAAGRACREIEQALQGLIAQQTSRDWDALGLALDGLARSIASWDDVLDVIRTRALA